MDVSEDFLNRSLRRFSKTDVIQQVIEGKYSMNAPLPLKAFSEVDYSVSLINPFQIDVVSTDMIDIRFAADVKLVYNLIKLESRVRGIVRCKPVYNRGSNQIELDVKEVTLGNFQVFNALNIPGFLVEALNNSIQDMRAQPTANPF